MFLPIKSVLVPRVAVHDGPPAKLCEQVAQRLQPDDFEAIGVHAGLVLRLGHFEDGGVALGDVGLQNVPQLLLEVVVNDGKLRARGAVVGDPDLVKEEQALGRYAGTGKSSKTIFPIDKGPCV